MALAIEVVRTDSGERENISCASSPVRVGRSPLNNVVLAAPWVSLHHGLIHFDEQHANYSDLGSTNGTTVMVKDQEMKLHPMVPMQILGAGQPTAELRIGVITLRVRWEAPAATGTKTDKRGGYETRLGEVKPGAMAGTAPRYPGEPPRGGAPVPMYQAGMTRMVMPGEQANLQGGGGPATPVHTPMAVPQSAPQPDALARL